MTLQQFEYIVAVDKYRHFVKAAESCHVTQSTLSALIQKLETELDVTIFDRNSHPIRPTEVGEELIRQAKVVLYNSSQLREMVVATKQQESGVLRMGVVSTIAPYILPKMFKIMNEDYKAVRLSVEEARVATIIQKLERAELDVALLAMPLDHKDLLEIPLYEERFVAYVSSKEPLFEHHELTVNELPTDNLWVLREGYCPNNGIFAFCSRQTGNASIYEAGSIETLVKIVDENGGYTIIPELHVPLLSEEQQRQIRVLRDPEPKRRVALVVRRDFVRERLLNILADAIKKVIPQHMIEERMKKFAIKL